MEILVSHFRMIDKFWKYEINAKINYTATTFLNIISIVIHRKFRGFYKQLIFLEIPLNKLISALRPSVPFQKGDGVPIHLPYPTYYI